MEEENIVLPKTTEAKKPRETWMRSVDFIITCVASTVGFGNIWRFPYLCYKMGGGAFLIPYIIAVATIGFPIVYLEVVVGQYMKQGAIGMWKICPLFKGVGILTVVLGYGETAYYMIIFVWFLMYLGSSFHNPLQWTHCNNAWNTRNCSEFVFNMSESEELNATRSVLNITKVSPSIEFWRHYILEISSGLEESGSVVWKLLVCLTVLYVLVYFCMWKGMKWLPKIAYITGTLPYLLLTVLLIMGATKEGALNGILFYLKPDLSKLLSLEVWYSAVCQVMFSCALGLTIWPAMGSYNTFHQNSYRQTIIICVINSLTSLFSGFVIFVLLGHMAHVQNVPIDKVATSGPGLVFVVYPQALGQLPLPQLWSFLFFLTMTLIGIDSVIVMIEAVIIATLDTSLYLRQNRKLFVLAMCIIFLLCGIPMITQGGMYIFVLVDYYLFGGLMVMIIALLETIGIGWIYGADKLYDNIEHMIGYRINIWLKLCWRYISPILILAVLVYQLITIKLLVYDTYVYPQWVCILVITVVGLLASIVPVHIIYNLLNRRSMTTMERIKYLRQPILEEHQVPIKWKEGSHLWLSD